MSGSIKRIAKYYSEQGGLGLWLERATWWDTDGIYGTRGKRGQLKSLREKKLYSSRFKGCERLLIRPHGRIGSQERDLAGRPYQRSDDILNVETRAVFQEVKLYAWNDFIVG